MPHLVPVAITTKDGTVEVLAEPTDAKHLFVNPTASVGRYNGGFALTHVPTGLAVIFDRSPDKLRALAEKVAHLDWSFTTPGGFEPIRAEASALLRDAPWDDPSAVDLPAHDHRGPDGKAEGIPRGAVSLARWSLEQIQEGYERTGSGDKAVPFEIDDPTAERGKRVNPEWSFWILRNVTEFGIAYLLLALHRLDPAAADAAAAWLAHQWEWGDGMGELAWDWHQALVKGERYELPGVPDLGPLLTATPRSL